MLSVSCRLDISWWCSNHKQQQNGDKVMDLQVNSKALFHCDACHSLRWRDLSLAHRFHVPGHGFWIDFMFLQWNISVRCFPQYRLRNCIIDKNQKYDWIVNVMQSKLSFRIADGQMKWNSSMKASCAAQTPIILYAFFGDCQPTAINIILLSFLLWFRCESIMTSKRVILCAWIYTFRSNCRFFFVLVPQKISYFFIPLSFNVQICWLKNAIEKMQANFLRVLAHHSIW